MNYSKFNGTYFNNPSRNTGLNVPPPDAVQEFRIQTSAFSAESGRNAGAILTVVSRQGTNDFHGALWEFMRNDNLNARSFFQTVRPQLVQTNTERQLVDPSDATSCLSSGPGKRLRTGARLRRLPFSRPLPPRSMEIFRRSRIDNS